MENPQLESVAFYFGGYRQFDLEQRQTAFSTWMSARHRQDECIINLCRGPEDSLLRRWSRVEKQLQRLADRPAIVHVLAYSMGCHLALKFAVDLMAVQTDRVKIGKVCFIGPDPKFRKNDLDDEELESAYDEANEFWGAIESPGDAFALRFRGLKRKPSSPLEIVFSKSDPVAVWQGNLEKLYSACVSSDEVHWIEADLGEARDSDSKCACHLDPSEAQTNTGFMSSYS